jgi:hypothetical protein
VTRQAAENFARTLPVVAVDAQKTTIFGLLRCIGVVSLASIVIE